MTKREVGVVGDRLRMARERLGLSQEEVSAAMGIKPNALGRYEREEVDPTGLLIRGLAQKLEVSSDYILGLDDKFGEDPERAELSIELRKIAWLLDQGLDIDAIEIIAGLSKRRR